MATAITNLAIISETTTGATLTDVNSTGQALNNYGIYAAGFKTAFDGSETSILLTPSAITESATGTDNTWTFPITADGWFRFIYIAAPFWDVATTYSQYDLAYDETNDTIYQANAAVTGGSAPSSNASFTQVTDFPDLITEVGSGSDAGNMVYQDFDVIVYPNAKKKFGDASAAAALECCTDCERSSDVESWELLKVMIDGMAVADSRDEFIKGEKIARRAEQL